jgi:phage gp36-like protein
MQNGHELQPTQINPQTAATYALQFLENVAHTRAQREAYDIAVGLLQAIASGQVSIGPPPRAQVPVQPEVTQ